MLPFSWRGVEGVGKVRCLQLHSVGLGPIGAEQRGQRTVENVVLMVRGGRSLSRLDQGLFAAVVSPVAHATRDSAVAEFTFVGVAG